MTSTEEALEELTAGAPFRGWTARAITYGPGEELGNELELDRAAIEAALAEAGYPDADVYIENGIMVEGAPDELVDKALELVRRVTPRGLPA